MNKQKECVTEKKRKPNSKAGEQYSLRCYSESRALLKITHIVETRPHCVGRGGRPLSKAPKTPQELEERQQILFHYFGTHQVRKEDIEFHPASHNPPSEEQVIYVFVPDSRRDIERVRYVANAIHGLNCYKEPVPMFPPRGLEMAM